jgi:hypothetical protein
MAVVEVRTFKDIQDAILRRGKIEDNESNRTEIKEYINTLYQEINREEAYRWSGATMPIRLRGKYTTGTITATDDSDEITGASTVFSANDHTFSKMRISGSNTPFTIKRVGSATTCTLNQYFIGTTASSLSYVIYKDTYGLFPDFQDIRKLRIPGLATRNQPKPAGIDFIDRLRDRSPFREGVPIYYTVFDKAIYTEKTWATFNLDTDYWEDALTVEPRNISLVVWPGILTDDRMAQVRYTKVVYPMGADSHEPAIPYEDRAVLVWGVLAERFLVNRDIGIRREWRNEYLARKQKMASDIESTDDSLVLTVDKSQFRRGRRSLIDEDELLET